MLWYRGYTSSDFPDYYSISPHSTVRSQGLSMAHNWFLCHNSRIKLVLCPFVERLKNELCAPILGTNCLSLST